MPATYRDIIQKSQDAVADFSAYLPVLEKKVYNRLQAIINRLELDADGNIEVSDANLQILDDLKEAMQRIPKDKEYMKNVAGLKKTLADIEALQTAYFESQFVNFLKPDVMDAIQEDAFKSAVSSLTESGINANVVNKAVQLARDSITSGSSFLDMSDQLKAFMVSTPEVPGKLQSYAKQVVNDTIHTTSRIYNARVAEDLGLNWFEYIGGLMKTSRPWCVAMEGKKYINRQEFAKVCRGDIDGKKVSLQGLMPDTNASNVESRCGGYNCEHHMAPVPDAVVPTSLRRQFEPDISPDDEEVSDERPRNKRR